MTTALFSVVNFVSVNRLSVYYFTTSLRHSGSSRTFSLGGGGSGAMVFGRKGHSTGTTIGLGLLLRTILCKSLVLMPRVKFVKNTQNMHATTL